MEICKVNIGDIYKIMRIDNLFDLVFDIIREDEYRESNLIDIKDMPILYHVIHGIDIVPVLYEYKNEVLLYDGTSATIEDSIFLIRYDFTNKNIETLNKLYL